MPSILDTSSILWVKMIPEEIFIHSIEYFVVAIERDLIHTEESPKHPFPFILSIVCLSLFSALFLYVKYMLWKAGRTSKHLAYFCQHQQTPLQTVFQQRFLHKTFSPRSSCSSEALSISSIKC